MKTVRAQGGPQQGLSGRRGAEARQGDRGRQVRRVGRRRGQPRRRREEVRPDRARLGRAAGRAPARTVRVAVFAQGDKAKAAQDAGADIVGFDDLAARIKEGFMEFDVVIASPDAMRVVGQLGQILGPRGLMPNPKVGTVTADVVTAVKNAKAGPGPVPHRQGRHHPVHDRPRVVRARAAQDQPARADRGAEQGEARRHQGHLPEEGQRLEHDGRRRAGRSNDVAAATDSLRRGATHGEPEARRCLVLSDTAGPSDVRAVKDRRSPRGLDCRKVSASCADGSIPRRW